VFYKDRLHSHQVHLTVLQTYTCTQYTIIDIIHAKNESKHSEMGPLAAMQLSDAH